MCEIILFVFYFNEMAFEESSDFSIFLKKKVNQQNSSLIFKKNQLFKFEKTYFHIQGKSSTCTYILTLKFLSSKESLVSSTISLKFGPVENKSFVYNNKYYACIQFMKLPLCFQTNLCKIVKHLNKMIWLYSIKKPYIYY